MEPDLVKYKQIICREANSLTDSDKKTVRNIIKRKSSKHIKVFSDGIRINLDLLNDDVIIELYNFIKYKLNLE